MTEKPERGNDEQLPAGYRPEVDIAIVEGRLQDEQDRVDQQAPASEEPGEQYPDPDQAPEDR